MRYLLLAVSFVLIACGCAKVKPQEAKDTQALPFQDHTNPPIIVGKGSLTWYVAEHEHADECKADSDCSDGYTCFAEEVKSQRWCVKKLDPGYRVFNTDGTCTGEEKKTHPGFIAYGTEWARHGTFWGGERIKGNGRKFKGVDYELELEVGDKHETNNWLLTWNGAPGGPKSCSLTWDGSMTNLGKIPQEFVWLLDIHKKNDAKKDPPLGFATCKCPGCERPDASGICPH